jgi:hypothetical protein
LLCGCGLVEWSSQQFEAISNRQRDFVRHVAARRCEVAKTTSSGSAQSIHVFEKPGILNRLLWFCLYGWKLSGLCFGFRC